MNEKQIVIPFSLKDAPALIEKVLPAQKLSIESYKEQMAVGGKTLTALGSYWKGRKPLILNKACILGSLLPASENLKKDLEIFEKLMAMDNESFTVRIGRFKPEDIVQKVSLQDIYKYFDVDPFGAVPISSAFILSDFRLENGRLPKITWREDISEPERRKIETLALPKISYRELVKLGERAESCLDIHEHIWEEVNLHLGTNANSFPELIEQLGIMRFGHRPRIGDTFCGSGQIPFEAARLGCDVYASDLNPIACMLTWGAFNIVGGTEENLNNLAEEQKKLLEKVRNEIDELGVETDENGWRGKVYLYCVEVRCPQTGWLVPLLHTRVISKGYHVIAELIPDKVNKRYEIKVRSGATDKELSKAEQGTVKTDGKGLDPYMVHTVNGIEYRTKISTLRGDFKKEDGSVDNRLRLWEKNDFVPSVDDIFQERLYCVQWMRPKKGQSGYDYEFRSVSNKDLEREKKVEMYINKNFIEWQQKGWIPDTKIEIGYNTRQPIWERGWTYWNHLFNPRQLMLAGLVSKLSNTKLKYGLTQILNSNCRLSRWDNSSGGGGTVKGVFDNQALNTLYNFGCRGTEYLSSFICQKYKCYPSSANIETQIINHSVDKLEQANDIYITDPPYGDAVKYEEILEFFIAWLYKNPPEEFSSWVWDSRRALAIKGEDEDFRQKMVAAYRQMTEKMADNGIQIIMFTHQSGSIWSDMANIVWAAGLQVTSAWYVVTETDNAQRKGSHVKGTVLLVLRKRQGNYRVSRGDLAWDIKDEVEEQIQTLTGLNQETKNLSRDENLFEDADLQMAGYAAALRVLTRYAFIDGKDMAIEAIRPRVKGEKTFVDELIDFAVSVANQCLVPQGISKIYWDKLLPAERFYLKLIEMEAKGLKTLDNYENFAKAFKVKDHRTLMASQRANSARLKSAVEFGKTDMSGDSEFAVTILRGVLYGIMELVKDKDSDEVLAHLSFNIPNYLEQTKRNLIVELSDYLAIKLESIRKEEASAARILRELVINHRLG